MSTDLIGFEFPAADGMGYGIRILSADGEYLTIININWRTGAEIGEPHQLLRFKAEYRYNFLQGRKNEP